MNRHRIVAIPPLLLVLTEQHLRTQGQRNSFVQSEPVASYTCNHSQTVPSFGRSPFTRPMATSQQSPQWHPSGLSTRAALALKSTNNSTSQESKGKPSPFVAWRDYAKQPICRDCFKTRFSTGFPRQITVPTTPPEGSETTSSVTARPRRESDLPEIPSHFSAIPCAPEQRQGKTSISLTIDLQNLDRTPS
jgi:hypothetical protein